MLYEILYLDNSYKARFSDLKKRVKINYVLKKAEYPRTVTAVQSLLLNYQPNYNSNGSSKYNRVSNQLMFAQRGKTGDGEGDRKIEGEDNQEKYGSHHLQRLWRKRSLFWEQ